MHDNVIGVIVHFLRYMVVITQKLAKIRQYIEETLGETIRPAKWEQAGALPFYLRDAYRFLTVQLLGQECLLMLPSTDEPLQPGKIKKHWLLLQEKQDLPVCVVAEHLASFQRRSLMEQRVPFIAANKQLFLLPLGLDLREHQVGPASGPEKPLSPTAQLILLHTLYAEDRWDGATTTEVAEKLAVTAMTVSRAARELREKDLIVLESMGRTKHLRSPEQRGIIWERSKPLLRSPVRKRLSGFAGLHDIETHEMCIAGETALAEQTMLAAPKMKMIALAEKRWSEVRKVWAFRESGTPKDGNLTLELWRYDPLSLAVDMRVDPLSLLLSLAEESDERVTMAMDELEASIPWLR